jgi:hypothetical protein
MKDLRDKIDKLLNNLTEILGLKPQAVPVPIKEYKGNKRK